MTATARRPRRTEVHPPTSGRADEALEQRTPADVASPRTGTRMPTSGRAGEAPQRRWPTDVEANQQGVPRPSAPRRHRVRNDERGAGYLAAFIVLFSVLVFAVVGLLVDVSRYYTAYRRVDVMSMEAARAGANAIDALPLGAGQTAVDPGRAHTVAAAAVSSFVDGTDVRIDSIEVSGTTVTVALSETVSPRFALFSSRTVSARSHADAVATRSSP